MADGMTGIERLRKLADDVIDYKVGSVLSCVRLREWEAMADARLSDALRGFASQIEREHAEELASAKRDLTDEARTAIAERLRATVGKPGSYGARMASALGVTGKSAWELGEEGYMFVVDRLCELIEHGGKRGADVAALRELADDMDKRAHGAYGKTFVNASMYAGLMHGLSKRIRKAVEGATVPDAESEAERACAALLEWRDQVAGMLGIDGGSMADEVQDAIMAELDKRLMPPGMEWPRWEDGKQLCEDAAPDGVTVVSLYLDGSGYGLADAILDHQAGDRVKRPELEALGTDGEPIKVGETVWYVGEPLVRGTVESVGECEVMLAGDGVYAPSDLTHERPETQERIDKDAIMPPRRYYAEKIGHDVGLKEDEEVFAAVALDLLLRQRELDAKTMGGE